MSKLNNSNIIDEKAQKIFNYNIPENWICRDLPKDQGIDYQIEVFDENRESTEINFLIQLKGTEKIQIKEDVIKFHFSTERLNDYVSKSVLPVFLILVDVMTEEIYWLFLQKYVNESIGLENSKLNDQHSVTLNIPTLNNFKNDKEIIEQEAKSGVEYCNYLMHGDIPWDLKCRINRVIGDSEGQERLLCDDYKKIFNVELNMGMDLLNDEHTGSYNHFQSVYKKTKNDERVYEEHLQSIFGIISFLHVKFNENFDKILSYSYEGLEIAKKYGDAKFSCLFKARIFEVKFYSELEQLMNNIVLQKLHSSQNTSFSKYNSEILLILQSENYKLLSEY